MDQFTQQFGSLSLRIACRHRCGKHFNNAPCESRHALHFCKLNSQRRPMPRRKKRACPKCGKLIVNLKRHLTTCRA